MARMQARYGRAGAVPDNVVEETASAVTSALRNYFSTHPPYPERMLRLERARAELGLELEGRRWFLGELNHAERTSSRDRERPEDFREGRLE
jgi:hypothetical protein